MGSTSIRNMESSRGKIIKVFTGERAWILPEHSLGPELGGPGEPE